MTHFWVGTSGWQYKHWRERFYPKGLPEKDWLTFYAERFRTVEINNSFYMQPSEKSWERWRALAPEGFRYAVKAHRYLTHRKRLRDCEDALERMVTSARRLDSHLGPLLFQLPPYFNRTEANATRLESFLDLLPGDLPCSFEFREKSWFGEDTMRQLQRGKVAFCSFDKPDLACPLVATAGFAYIRFHGSVARHGGKYTDQMLQKWAERVSKLPKEVDEVYVYFNNDAYGYAIANAVALGRLLGVSPRSRAAVAAGS